LLIASSFFPVGRSGRDNSDDLDRLSVLLVIPDGMGLAKLKTKYDPGNMFRLNQNIKPGSAHNRESTVLPYLSTARYR
jgi:Berberine and berberine like